MWPWTLNIKGKGYYFSTKEKAYKAIIAARKQGIESIDIGLMQVNWHWNKDKLKTPWQALDPKYNITVAAHILRKCYDKKRNWWQCAGDYHTGGNYTPKSDPKRAVRAQKYRKRVYNNLARET